MHHMSGAWHSVQRAVRNVRVKARRLLINVDQSIFLAGNDDDGHFQVGVALAEGKRVGDHESCLSGAGPNL